MVAGLPKGQGSNHRISKHGHIYDATKGLGEWRAHVGWVARANVTGPPSDQPCGLDLWFRLPAPKRNKREYPTTKPDIDKLARAVLDALTRIVYDDDSRVVLLSARKTYASDPSMCGVTVSVSWL